MAALYALPGKSRFWGSRSVDDPDDFPHVSGSGAGVDARRAGASAQGPCITNFCPPPNPSQPSRDSNDKTVWYVVGGIAAAALGAFIAWRLFPDPERGLPPEPPSADPPPLQPVNLPPPGGGAGAPSAGKSTPKGTTAALRKGFNLPPPGAPFVPNEVILDVPTSVSEAQLNAISGRHGMTRMETQTFRLTGRRLFRWRIDNGTNVSDMIRSISGETQVAGAQANYLFTLAQEQLPQMNSDQYAPERLNLPEAHKLATGSRVLVAVIDSGIDASHPDLAGAIVRSYDAAAAATNVGSGSATASTGEPHPHGTGMAGAIAARRSTLGVAPRVGVLAVRAFDPRSHQRRGHDVQHHQGRRVVGRERRPHHQYELCRAGRSAARRRARPRGEARHRADRGRRQCRPEFAAAVSRRRQECHRGDRDRHGGPLYTGAVRGNHIAVAAPGVEILVPAPGGNYQFTTGTSVAAAHVSGVAALLLERNPKLTTNDVRRILTRTAKSLGRDRSRDFGAGLVNAYQAVSSASSREAGAPKQSPASTGQRCSGEPQSIDADQRCRARRHLGVCCRRGTHAVLTMRSFRLHPPAALRRIGQKPQPEGRA